MPRGDGTGPWGLGPRTGRAAGFCAGYAIPGYMNPTPRYGIGPGVGISRGRGRSFGRGFWCRSWGISPIAYYPNPSPDEEKTYLENVIKSLESEVEEIRARIKELEKEK